MGNFIYNIAKGRVGYYTMLPASTDSLIAVFLELSGLPADSVLKDCDTLSDVLATAATEQTTVGRLTLAGVTSTVDDATDKNIGDFDNDELTGATGNPIGALVVCYVPTSGAADSAIIPLTNHTFVVTPNSGDIAVLVSPSGFYQAP